MSRRNILLYNGSIDGAPTGRWRGPERVMVNFKYSRIFNGIFKSRKSREKQEKPAEMRQNVMKIAHVNYMPINYDRILAKYTIT